MPNFSAIFLACSISFCLSSNSSLSIAFNVFLSKTIKKILGDSYNIEASFGHVRNLPLKDPKTDNLGFDVNLGLVEIFYTDIVFKDKGQRLKSDISDQWKGNVTYSNEEKNIEEDKVFARECSKSIYWFCWG